MAPRLPLYSVKTIVFPSAESIGTVGEVEPRQVPLGGLSGQKNRHSLQEVVPGGEPPSVRAHVANRQASRAFERGPPAARERHGEDVEGAVGVAGREQDLLPVGRPGEALLAPEPVGQNGLPALEIHDGDLPPVVPLDRVLEESDPVAARREPQVAQVAARLAQDFSDGELQAVLSADLADHGEARAVGRPVRLAHVLENVSRRPSLERHLRQRALENVVRDVARARQQREVAARGDGEQVHAAQAQRPGLRELRAHREELRRVPLQGRAVDDRPAVGSEAGVEDRLLAVRQLLKGGAAPPGRVLRAAPGDIGRGGRPGEEHGDRRRKEPALPVRGRQLSGRSRTPKTPDTASRSNARSCAEWKRCSGFFSMQCRTMRSRPGEMVWFVTERSGGSSLRIADIVSAAESPWNALSPREHLVQDRAEREDVRPRVGRLALDLLGRHVAERAHHDAGLRPRRGRRQVRRLAALFLVRQLREAEVEDLETAVFGDEQVLGLQVAVDDPLLVRRGEAVRDLQRVVDRLSRRQLPAGERRAQRLAFEQLLTT